MTNYESGKKAINNLQSAYGHLLVSEDIIRDLNDKGYELSNNSRSELTETFKEIYKLIKRLNSAIYHLD